MKIGQVAIKQQFSSVGRGRGFGLVMSLAAAVVAAVLSGAVLVAESAQAKLIAGDELAHAPDLDLWTMAQSTAPPNDAVSDAVVPPVRREAPQTPAAPAAQQPAPAPATPGAAPSPNAVEPSQKPAETLPQPAASQQASGKSPPPPPDVSGIFGTIQDWLARANREYQGVVVKELSLPPAGPAKPDDEIAKKLKDQDAETAAKIAAQKRDEEAARKEAEAKAAMQAKSQDAKKFDEDRRRAEETKRLADEAKKKADEIFKSEAGKKPEVAVPASPVAPKPDDAARLEAEKKQADEAKQEQAKLEQLKQEQAKQEQARKAEEAKAQAQAQVEERKRAEAAAKADAERRRAAEAQENKNRARTIVIVPEPLPAPVARPVDPGSTFRPELSPLRSAQSNGTRSREADADTTAPVSERHRRIKMRYYSEATYRGINIAAFHRGTAVKRWVWRDSGSGCSRAGQRISPPSRYTIARGDSLWRISEKQYSDGRKYPKIYRANRSIIADPDLIYPCQRVLVPR